MQRTREIGIRVALGAAPGGVAATMLARGLRLVAIGIGLGVVGAFAATRSIESLLFGVTALDPFTFAVVPLALLLAGGVASWMPARRALAVDPIEALRAE